MMKEAGAEADSQLPSLGRWKDGADVLGNSDHVVTSRLGARGQDNAFTPSGDVSLAVERQGSSRVQ